MIADLVEKVLHCCTLEYFHDILLLMKEWLDPIYKKLALSELGTAGHTSGIVPVKNTQLYFGLPRQDSSHLMRKIFVEFWGNNKSKIIVVNVNYFKSETHDHIHLTGNLFPAYRDSGAEVGDVLVFWKSIIDSSSYKAELIKQGSKRWNMAGKSAFQKTGGTVHLSPPLGETLDDNDSDYGSLSEVEEEITAADFPTIARHGRQRQGERFITIRSKAKGDFVLKQQEYKCQIDSLHKSFITKAGLPYMEKHHLISMMYYEEYENDLDDVSNIVSLCPNCHRQIHLGRKDDIGNILDILFKKQKDKLTAAKLLTSIKDLKVKYGIV